MAGKTNTYLLCQAATAFTVLLLAVLLFQAAPPSLDSMADIAGLLLKLLLVVSCWWLNNRLFRYLRVQARIRKAREKVWKRQVDRSDIQNLKAQIQPHFLFNTLNCINASIPPQQEATRELIARLADTFRYALQATKEDEVCLADELQFIQTYLELEKERFKDRLQIHIDAPECVQKVRIAPMLLQPLIENAVIHGIAPSITGGSIHLHCRLQNGKVQISISNTGAGYTGPVEWLLEGKGVGLKNTILRLEKIYHEPLIIEKNPAGGLTCLFSIPAGR